jgi:hypothetical protein
MRDEHSIFVDVVCEREDEIVEPGRVERPKRELCEDFRAIILFHCVATVPCEVEMMHYARRLYSSTQCVNGSIKSRLK